MNKTYLLMAFIISLMLFTISKSRFKEKECSKVSESTVIICLENNQKDCEAKGLEAYFRCREK